MTLRIDTQRHGKRRPVLRATSWARSPGLAKQNLLGSFDPQSTIEALTTQVHLLQSQLHELTNRERNRELALQALAHDLHNPLTSIAAALSGLASASDNLNQAQHEMLDIARRSVDKTLRLSADLLALLQLETGCSNLRLTPTDLGALIEGVLTVQIPLARRKGIRLTWSVAPDVPLLLLEPDLMARVMQNLLDNALKYTPEKGRIDVVAALDRPRDPAAAGAALPQPGWVRIDVTDNGPGVEPALRETLFERQVRGHDGRAGRGIGLALCQEVVRGHGGAIAVDTTWSPGARFVIHLPVRRQEVCAAQHDTYDRKRMAYAGLNEDS